MKEGSTLLITGGTGSFGNVFVPLTLKKYQPKYLIIYSRDEMKQWEMAKRFEDDKRVRFIIGDVRDADRLRRSLVNIDYVVHAAATKIVPTAEYNPIECIKTNINGATNLIEACLDQGVKKVVALSTDKASNPINLYGATKLASDKLFIAANLLGIIQKTKFSVVRYGNVMGSRGSVIPFFIEQAEQGTLTITDPKMTRFMITLEQGVDMVWQALNDMEGGEIYVKKIPSMNICNIAKAVSTDAEQKIIGIRAGEKVHEQMIGAEDSAYTFEYKDYYKILPVLNDLYKEQKLIKDGKPVADGFCYASDTNSEWMEVSYLKEWIHNYTKSRQS